MWYSVIDGDRTFLNWSVLNCFLTKKQICYRKFFILICHLNCILWMKDNIRHVVYTFLNAVFKPSLKIGVYAFQCLTINCCHFLPDCLLQIGQGARFVSTAMWFEVPLQKKVTSGQMMEPSGPRDIAETWNYPSWKHATNHVHWQSCSVWGGTILLKINILHVV